MKKLKMVLIMVMFVSLGTAGIKQGEVIAKVDAGYLDQTDLDNRVIFQNFSLFQPYEKNMYSTLSQNVDKLKKWGVTDVWTAPGYRSFGQARYMEGYAVADRYDLGEFPQGLNNEIATKYGTSAELKALVSKLHQSGLKIQMDLVPNQMMGLNNREALKVTRTDAHGKSWGNPHTTKTPTKIVDKLYLAYTKGAGSGQKKYGTIKELNKTHFIGTSLQKQDFRTLEDTKGRPYQYFGPNNASNYLPDRIKGSEADRRGQINTVDGYLSVDGWMCTSSCETQQQQWSPILAQYPSPGLDKILTSRKMSRQQYMATDATTKANVLNEYLTTYFNGSSEEESLSNSFTGIDSNDQLLFAGKKTTNTIGYATSGGVEFLVGLDLDYSNNEVNKDTSNWIDFLLKEYDFDGFRVDAAAHFDRSMLNTINQKVKAKGNGSIAYLETYGPSQKAYADSVNNDMMTMNYDLFYSLNKELGNSSANTNVAAIFDNNNRYGASSVQKLPNWSFVSNHDQEKNQINKIIIAKKGTKVGSKPSFYDVYTKELEREAMDIYFNDMKQVDKKWAPHNVLSQYAYMLSMKNTTPTVFYGDLYQGNQTYMSTPTIYYDGITKMLEARKQFAKGDEQQYRYRTAQSAEGQDLVANVRIGTNKNEGMAVVISDNAAVNETIQVNVGKIHAGQKYRDILGRNTARPVVDSNGNITIQVKGMKDVQVSGHVGVWIPEIAESAESAKQELVGFSQDGTKMALNLSISASEGGSALSASRAQVTLKSETTGWEYTIPSSQVTQAANNRINVKVEEGLLTRGETYVFKINGRAITTNLGNQTATFANAKQYSLQNNNGEMQISVFKPNTQPPTPPTSTYVQKFQSFNKTLSGSNLNVIVTATENNRPLRLDQTTVVLRSETTGWEYTVPSYNVYRDEENTIRIQMTQSLFTRGDKYTLRINGRLVTNTLLPQSGIFDNWSMYTSQSKDGIFIIDIM